MWSLPRAEVRFFALLRMTRRLNKRAYVSLPPGGEVIEDYYLVPALQQFLN